MSVACTDELLLSFCPNTEIADRRSRIKSGISVNERRVRWGEENEKKKRGKKNTSSCALSSRLLADPIPRVVWIEPPALKKGARRVNRTDGDDNTVQFPTEQLRGPKTGPVSGVLVLLLLRAWPQFFICLYNIDIGYNIHR